MTANTANTINNDDRNPRDIETRESASRESTTFVPPGLLPEFKKEPGYDYRWVRVATLGESDIPNLNARMREGWEPVKATEHPELTSFRFKSNERDPFDGYIENGGLVLCKSSKEKIDARRAHFDKVAGEQIQAVDNDLMRENDARMPLFRERTTKVTRGSG